jgi:hypothetical protein
VPLFTACKEGSEATTLKSPEIKPVPSPPGNSLVVPLPDVNGVPPTEYEIMEVDVDTTKPVFPFTVVIYDENDVEVFSVSV